MSDYYILLHITLQLVGPSSDVLQYKEIRNVAVWLECLRCVSSKAEIDVLTDIHRTVTSSDKVS